MNFFGYQSKLRESLQDVSKPGSTVISAMEVKQAIDEDQVLLQKRLTELMHGLDPQVKVDFKERKRLYDRMD